MNGHPPGAAQLEQLRLRRGLQASASRSGSISSNTESTISSNEAASISERSNPNSSPFGFIPKGTLGRLFLLFLIFRLFNALLTKTFFQPDEYWQSLEIAHRVVFGFGYQTWEWQPTSNPPISSSSTPAFSTENLSSILSNLASGPVRSFAFPAIHVPLFWALKVLRLDNTFLLTLAPRLLQAGFAAVGDLYTFQLSQKVLNEKAAYLTILISYLSLYGLYTSTRTFSNSLESVLTVIGLYYWPLSLPEKDIPGADPLRATDPIDRLSIRYALCAASAACIIRPTNAVIWLFLLLNLVRNLAIRVDSVSSALEVCFQMVAIGKDGLWILAGALTLTLGLDSVLYSSLTFTPFSFLYHNVFKSISLFYGSHPVHWYLSQGIPVLTFTCFPFLLHGIYVSLRSSSPLGISKKTARWFGTNGERDLEALRSLTQVALFTILVFSLIGHKEFRFLQPLIPIFNILITYSLMELNRRGSGSQSIIQVARNRDVIAQIEREDSNGSIVGSDGERVLVHGRPPLIYSNISGCFDEVFRFISFSRHQNWTKGLLLIQLPFSVYLCHFHCKAQVEVMFQVQKLFDSGRLKSVGFLMPCHSTPWQSHVHREGLETDESEKGLRSRTNRSGDDGLMWFLTCEPPRDGQAIADYQDQSDFFYSDPLEYLTSRFPTSVDPTFPPSPPTLLSAGKIPHSHDLGWRHTWPSHIVVFENLLLKQASKSGRSSERGKSVGNLLEEKGYVIRESLWNSFKHEDPRRDGDIVILEWTSKGR